MSLSYDDFGESEIKHLEMIQAVISRLSTDSFVIKGWAITVAGAFFGFAISRNDWRLALVSVVPSVIFWALDTYFLHSERAFRALFDEVRERNAVVPPFFLSATSPSFLESRGASSTTSWSQTFRRPTLTVLYGGLIVAAGVVALIAANLEPPPRSASSDETAPQFVELTTL